MKKVNKAAVLSDAEVYAAIRTAFRQTKAVIFDLDDTLLSYQASERAVIQRIWNENRLPITDEAIAAVWEASWAEWDRMCLSETDRPEVAMNFHRLYRQYLRVFFDVLKQTFPLADSVDVLCEKFVDYLADQTPLCEGAESLLYGLDGRYILAVATNGLSAIQNARIDRLPVKIANRFISEEMGCVKPSLDFFTGMTDKLGCSPEECLMIGDSLRSDIGGALRAGMNAIWIHHESSVGAAGCLRIDSLEKLLSALP